MPDTLDEYNRESPEQPRREMPFTVCVAVIMGALLIAICACLTGCYGSPIDTRAIDADKVSIVHSTPWTTLTIQAEGWHSTVSTKPKTPPENARP